MTTSRSNHQLAVARRDQLRKRRDRVLQCQFADRVFSNKDVCSELKLSTTEARNLLEKMCSDGDLDKVLLEADFGQHFKYRRRGNANFWLQTKWSTG